MSGKELLHWNQPICYLSYIFPFLKQQQQQKHINSLLIINPFVFVVDYWINDRPWLFFFYFLLLDLDVT